MKKPSFALYAAGFVACMLGCCFGIFVGIRYDLPVLLVLAGEAVVWSSMIFDRFHNRLRACLEFEYDKLKTQQIFAVRRFIVDARDQEVAK